MDPSSSVRGHLELHAGGSKRVDECTVALVLVQGLPVTHRGPSAAHDRPQ